VEPTREQAYQRRIAELEAENADLKALVAELRAQVARLSGQIAKLSKNSSNSSKPPSSDIVKPPKPKLKGQRKKQRRKIGGQKGHPKHERQPFAVEDLSDVWEYHLDRCPDCGGRVKRAEAEARVVQQVEVVESPIRIDEHRDLAYYCSRCEKVHYTTNLRFFRATRKFSGARL